MSRPVCPRPVFRLGRATARARRPFLPARARRTACNVATTARLALALARGSARPLPAGAAAPSVAMFPGKVHPAVGAVVFRPTPAASSLAQMPAAAPVRRANRAGRGMSIPRVQQATTRLLEVGGVRASRGRSWPRALAPTRVTRPPDSLDHRSGSLNKDGRQEVQGDPTAKGGQDASGRVPTDAYRLPSWRTRHSRYLFHTRVPSRSGVWRFPNRDGTRVFPSKRMNVRPFRSVI
jgi:hypothetical protein